MLANNEWSASEGSFGNAPELHVTYSTGEGKSGLINTTTGAVPFYTNDINPWNISLNQGESQILSLFVNATGNINSTYTFFVYANKTDDMSINNITSSWNVIIII